MSDQNCTVADKVRAVTVIKRLHDEVMEEKEKLALATGADVWMNVDEDGNVSPVETGIKFGVTYRWNRY